MEFTNKYLRPDTGLKICIFGKIIKIRLYIYYIIENSLLAYACSATSNW